MSAFVDYLHEVLAGFGPIDTRRMFGGHGVYRDGVMFALVAGDTLYLKGDETTSALFESRGLDRFAYEKSGMTVKLSYWEAPEEIFDDPDEALVWARRGFDAALRAQSRTAAGKKAKPVAE